MNCEFFAILVDDLAEERLSDTGVGRRLLNHARECSECGRHLLEAQALTEDLRALGAADAQEMAPDRVEAALLDYFRQRRRRGIIGALWERKWAAAAASVCLVAVGLGVWSGHRPKPARNSQPVVTAPSIPRTPRNIGPGEVSAQAGPNTAGSPGESAGSTHVEYSGFIPLPYGEGPPSPGSGQIVRVEVARSALASMGFPVTGAASESYVQADVLIGEDGIARAIRFDSQGDDSSR